MPPREGGGGDEVRGEQPGFAGIDYAGGGLVGEGFMQEAIAALEGGFDRAALSVRTGGDERRAIDLASSELMSKRAGLAMELAAIEGAEQRQRAGGGSRVFRGHRR